MKVIADTNFLVSAFASRGLSVDVFQLILAEHQLMTGEFILAEFKRVMLEKLKVPDPITDEAEELLRLHHVEPWPERPAEIPVSYEDDRWVLASVLQADAGVPITGDKDLLEIAEQVPQLNSITPRQFWELKQE